MSENLIAPEIDKPEYKLHKRSSFRVAAFFTGPVGVGIMFFRNYQNLDDMDRAKKALIISMILTIILFTVLILIPEEISDKIPNLLLGLIYLWITNSLFDKYHSDIIKAHNDNKGDYYNGWYTLSILFVSLILSFVLIIIILILSDPEFAFSDLFLLFT